MKAADCACMHLVPRFKSCLGKACDDDGWMNDYMLCRTGSQWVVQKYIERPLLIDGRKFDIRSYCLITPDHKVHMYKHSYIRTSSTAFDLNNLEDR